MSDSDWPYDVSPGTGCITTRQVMHECYPVLAILREAVRDTADAPWRIVRTEYDTL